MNISNNLRCVCVDDEPHALEILQLYVEKTNFLEVDFATTNPWEAIDFVKNNEVDILFLDIQMEGLTGLQVLDILDKKPAIILTTAYQEYALKGYEYKVDDYLLKPYSYDRFLKAVKGIAEKKVITNIEKSANEIDHIFIKGDAKNKFHRVLFSDILYIEGLRNYVQFHCENEKIITLQNMKKLQEELPAQLFFRIHKSYIINLNKIKAVEGNSVQLGDKNLPIGASYKSTFMQLFK